jgi:hypothetical protein
MVENEEYIGVTEEVQAMNIYRKKQQITMRKTIVLTIYLHIGKKIGLIEDLIIYTLK